MPQMAPINWLILFIMFSLIFLMFNMMNYYLFIPTTQQFDKKMLPTTSLNWKW